MEYIFISVAVILTLLVAVFIYFRKERQALAQIEELHVEETTEESDTVEPEPEDDDSQLNPTVSEVDKEEVVKSGYEKIELPTNMIPIIAQTLKDGAVVLHQSRTYRVEFSPEVVKGLKDKSMKLIGRVDGKGYMPAVKKEGVKGIYEQAVLVKRINPALLAHASVNLLTTVVGQQQLMEIQSSLKSMEQKLEALIQHRENDFAGRIEARFGYFKEVIERFRRNGITLGGVEDAEIEGFYTATLQDLNVLMKDLKGIVANIEGLKEHETLRKWGEAPVKKEYEQLVGQFNAKQELVLLNVQFIEECYEPYLRTIRNFEEAAVKSQALAAIVVENHSIIRAIEEKVKSIEENYRVKINFGIKALKYRNLESLKELSPKKISQQQVAEKEIPSELLVEVMEDDRAYAYVRAKNE
ncbi:DUF1572 domain-containing protein [Planococcus donghaensis]|uniref:DUF1572 domain-containing protein n=1 Tax=Planococcus donghaensis TaxID=414778 RepID=A0A1C7EKC0_9BACL|nr:DUF1572 domain-containing protein [Planococcus donghaensis]ANU24185.1 DUF1572 domain-containing protein [Planococcus donghaensis]